MFVVRRRTIASLQRSLKRRQAWIGVSVAGDEKSSSGWWLKAGAALAAVSAGGYAQSEEEQLIQNSASSIIQYRRADAKVHLEESAVDPEEDDVREVKTPGEYRSDLPLLSLKEIKTKKSQKAGGVWMTYGRGVYDVTEFAAQHPGGTKIMLAAGSSIEPFWNVFKAHHDHGVYEMLEELRIGNISAEDAESLVKSRAKSRASTGGDSYAHEPERNPALIVNSLQPFNAEPPAELLSATYITPCELFFVRNHLPVPVIQEDGYQLEILSHESPEQRYSISLETLKTKYPRHTITATLQCAGNRRSEMSETKSVKGLSWSKAAIGTANWTGARLVDVLTEIIGRDKVKSFEDGDFHVRFRGADQGPDSEHYETSVPATTALDMHRDAILAYEMNGMPLSRDHGFPLRAIVPGVVGARNVKFLDRITIASEESSSFWQQRDYRVLPPNVDYQTKDFFDYAGPAIQELPVTSAILEPAPGASLSEEDDLIVRGYAWSGGGRKVVRVDVSLDAGDSWQPAELIRGEENQPDHRAWAWILWELRLDQNELQKLGLKQLDIRCKAVDAAYNHQPEDVRPIWNPRGLLNNAWGRVQVFIDSSQ